MIYASCDLHPPEYFPKFLNDLINSLISSLINQLINSLINSCPGPHYDSSMTHPLPPHSLAIRGAQKFLNDLINSLISSLIGSHYDSSMTHPTLTNVLTNNQHPSFQTPKFSIIPKKYLIFIHLEGHFRTCRRPFPVF